MLKLSAEAFQSSIQTKVFFVCSFAFSSLSLDYHGNVDMDTSEVVARFSTRGTYRILCPLGNFCDFFVNALFLV